MKPPRRYRDVASANVYRGIRLIVAFCALCLSGSAHAATPSSGTLNVGNASVTWTGAPIAGANANESTCAEGVTCDTYTLRLEPGNYPNKRITLGINWLIPANDLDLFVHANTADGPIVVASRRMRSIVQLA